MQTKTKVAGTVLVFAIVGFMLNPGTPVGEALWGPMAETGGPGPTAAQFALLMGVTLVQALAFGAGLAFLLFGFGAIRRIFATEGQARAAQLSIAWSLASWVPHSALHMTAGADLGKLVAIEVLFHVTLILAAAALGWTLVRAAQWTPPRSAAGTVPRASAMLTVVRRP